MMGANPPNGAEMVQVPRGQPGNMTARQSGASQEISYSGETAASAIATAARAEVEARFAIAQRFPRDIMRVREKMLKACARPAFADAAIYRKPVGKGIEGPSIRMAEEFVRCMGNIATDVITLYDDPWKRIVKVMATDLENNVTHPASITVDKTVERRELKRNQIARSQRVNSYGDTVYLVDATDDEMLNKVNALTSKALRTCILRLVPGDLIEEAKAACYAVRRNRDAKDPSEARKKLCDAFATLGVTVEQLAIYIGHAVDKITLDEIDELRSVFQTVRDGEATWAEALDHRRGQEPATPPADPPAPGSGAGPTPPPDKPANLTEAAAAAKARRESKGAPAEPRKRNTIIGADGKPVDPATLADKPAAEAPPIDESLLTDEPGADDD